jgi:hypothetical protein
MELALRGPLSAVSLGEGLITSIWAALSSLTRESLSVEERARFEKLRGVLDQFGTYVLDAEEREDVLVRVDALLEDPAFHRELYDCLGAMPQSITLPATMMGGAQSGDVYATLFGKFLGPGARSSLRDVERSMQAFRECFALMRQTIPEEELTRGVQEFAARCSEEPLWFLNEPKMPVPVARCLLAGLRCDVFAISACEAVVRDRGVEGWLGLAIAENWAEQAREFLALFASFPGSPVPLDVVPLHKRFDLKALEANARAVSSAYARFNADAERSGEPVFPSDA